MGSWPQAPLPSPIDCSGGRGGEPREEIGEGWGGGKGMRGDRLLWRHSPPRICTLARRHRPRGGPARSLRDSLVAGMIRAGPRGDVATAARRNRAC